MARLLVLACVLALAIGVAALPPIAYRLDDIQCADSARILGSPIIQAFIRNQVPLTMSVITGGPGIPAGCYTQWLPDLIASSNNSMIEIASGTVNHNNLLLYPGANLDFELRTSRNTLISQFPTRPINVIVPPANTFNSTVAVAASTAGYTVMSPQCTIRQMSFGGAQPGDVLCPVNVFNNVAPFFVDPSTVGGLYYVPVGASVVKFGQETQLLNETDFLSAPATSCDGGAIGICSAAQQIGALGGNPTNRMANGATPFAVISARPSDMLNITTLTDATAAAVAIGAYWDRVLSVSKTLYSHYTISGILALNGINVANTTTLGSSSGMSGSSGMTGMTGTGSSLTGTGRLPYSAASTTAAGLSVAVAVIAAVAALF